MLESGNRPIQTNHLSTPGTVKLTPFRPPGKLREKACARIMRRAADKGSGWLDGPTDLLGFADGGRLWRFVSIGQMLRGQVRQTDCRLEVQPGEEAQMDFGAGPMLVGADGKKTKTWIFRVVLSRSRKGYTEDVLRQNTETFLRCLENAFRHAGGVSLTVNIDYVPGHIIDVLFPAAICARLARSQRKSGTEWILKSHNLYRDLSHFSSSASSLQMGFR